MSRVADAKKLLKSDSRDASAARADESGPTNALANLQKAPLSAWGKRYWYSLGAKPYPLEPELFYDLPQLIREHVLPGHTPDAPFLDADASVVSLGSCFARELRSYLQQAGFHSDNIWIPSGLDNTYAILDFISWCVTGTETESGFRYDTTSQGEIVEWKPEHERAQILEYLQEAGAFVFTLGLAEIWEDPETGGVFWR